MVFPKPHPTIKHHRQLYIQLLETPPAFPAPSGTHYEVLQRVLPKPTSGDSRRGGRLGIWSTINWPPWGPKTPDWSRPIGHVTTPSIRPLPSITNHREGARQKLLEVWGSGGLRPPPPPLIWLSSFGRNPSRVVEQHHAGDARKRINGKLNGVTIASRDAA